MRLLLAAVLVFLLGVAASPARADNPVATHQPAPAAPAATPAVVKHEATIIPGSPLAVLTGASPPAAPPNQPVAATPHPFGTDNLGLSLTSVIGTDADHTVDTFVAAVQQSTRLTPIWSWLNGFAANPARRELAKDIALGLLIAVVPALAAEAALRFALVRPRAALARRAAADPPPARLPHRHKGLAAAEAGETETMPHRRRRTLAAWGRLVFRGVLYLLLGLLPLGAFALVSGVILGAGLIDQLVARLSVVVVCNAYLACRLVLEAMRFFLAPKAPALRLVPASDARAARILRWVGLTLFTGALGYAAISVCEVLGLPRNGTLVLIRLVALAVHIEVALIIWKSRLVVASWIAGDRAKNDMVHQSRRRFAFVWHYLALFYVLALWIALAGGIHNAFSLLLRIVVVLVGASVFGRLAWTGSMWLLDHLLPEGGTEHSRRATIAARARAYNPLIRLVLQIVIIVGVVLLILQGWGFHIVPWLRKDKVTRGLISAFFSIVLTVAIALTLWECINALLHGRIERLAAAERTRQASRLRTLMPMLQATIGVPIGVVAGLVCLSEIGVNAAPLLAGAGVLGIAIGFGSQKLVQDIITGLFLLLEDAVQVGDVVNLAGMQGTVERLSIRTIRLRGADGSVNIIPFSAVTTVTNMTRDFGYAQISIQVDYEEDLTRVYALLEDIVREMRAEPSWGAMIRDDLKIFGLDQFGASALVITGQIRTGPGQHWAVRREFNLRVKRRFEAEHIYMPYAYLPPPPPFLSAQPPVVDGDKAATEAPPITN